jgi:hypothetical protein
MLREETQEFRFSFNSIATQRCPPNLLTEDKLSGAKIADSIRAALHSDQRGEQAVAGALQQDVIID